MFVKYLIKIACILFLLFVWTYGFTFFLKKGAACPYLILNDPCLWVVFIMAVYVLEFEDSSYIKK